MMLVERVGDARLPTDVDTFRIVREDLLEQA